jgi:hypothetical protein
LKNKIKPQIDDQLNGIEFDNEDEKLKVYRQAISNKTAREWGTKHANRLQEYDSIYNDNEIINKITLQDNKK